jgi:hypothetical protein
MSATDATHPRKRDVVLNVFMVDDDESRRFTFGIMKSCAQSETETITKVVKLETDKMTIWVDESRLCGMLGGAVRN